MLGIFYAKTTATAVLMRRLPAVLSFSFRHLLLSHPLLTELVWSFFCGIGHWYLQSAATAPKWRGGTLPGEFCNINGIRSQCVVGDINPQRFLHYLVVANIDRWSDEDLGISSAGIGVLWATGTRGLLSAVLER